MLGDEVIARAQILHFAGQGPQRGLDLGVLRGGALSVGCGGAGQGEVVAGVVCGGTGDRKKK